MQVTARSTAEHRHEDGLGQLRHLPHRRDPALVELARGGRSDSPEPLHRQRVKEGQLAVGRHDEQAVGLRDAARHLGEELRPRHAHRDRQADVPAHLATQPRGDLGGRPRDPLEPADVEERFVDREAFDERRHVVEHPEHRLARLGVDRHPRRHDDGTRAQPPCLPSTHCRAHSEGLGLVARCEHDASAHDYGPAAQARIVPLLDGRVERVEVGVEDRRRT